VGNEAPTEGLVEGRAEMLWIGGAIGTPLAADGRSLLSGLMRTAATDEHARRWFRRSRTFGVGSGAHILVHALLEMVRETAERAQTATQVQAG
jgi:hypothetical protein